MVVPTWVTNGITALNGLPAVASPTTPERDACESIRTYMVANNGAWPADAADRIRNAILAHDIARRERYIRTSLLSELQKIQAAG